MAYPGYGRHIAQMVRNVPLMDAILSKEIAAHLKRQFGMPIDSARTITNVELKRLADRGEIERVQKGVYCHVMVSVFGKGRPDIDGLMIRTLTRDQKKVIGYETGASLLNKMGLTTLLPRDREVAANRYWAKLPKGCHVKVRKPVVAVNRANWRYLQFIDAVRTLQKFTSAYEENEPVLRRYAETWDLDLKQLLGMAKAHYSPKMVSQLANLLA
jgi:hypothetical protein